MAIKLTLLQMTKSFLRGSAATVVLSFPAFGQELSLPRVVSGDCMGVSKPDPKFSSLPACQKMLHAVKRTKTGVVWSLVAQRTLAGKKYQIWYDGQTGLLWGDRLDSAYSHRQAITFDSEDRPTGKDICDSDEGQRAAAGIQSKKFRLPTIQDFDQAEADGIREVLPNMKFFFWTSSLYDPNKHYAHGYNGYGGNSYYGNRDGDYSVRCVAR